MKNPPVVVAVDETACATSITALMEHVHRGPRIFCSHRKE